MGNFKEAGRGHACGLVQGKGANGTGYQVYECAALSQGCVVLWGLRLRPLLRVATEPAFCPTHKLLVRSKVCKSVTLK